MHASQAAPLWQLSAVLTVCRLTAGMGPSNREEGGSEWLQRAFSVLQLEDVELDLEQLDTLGKVGSGVQGRKEQPAIVVDNLLQLLIWRLLAGH